jgi:hypothetical protein
MEHFCAEISTPYKKADHELGLRADRGATAATASVGSVQRDMGSHLQPPQGSVIITIAASTAAIVIQQQHICSCELCLH